MKQIIFIIVVLLLNLSMTVAQDETLPIWPNHYYAPYVYMAGYPSYFLAKTAETTGIRYFTLGFILDGPHECEAAWAGSIPLKNQNFLGPDLQNLRQMGGDVIISFGGAAGTELAQACPDVDSLVAQYQAVIDAYQVARLDFDIEGSEMTDTPSIERRSQALAALQALMPLDISFTLPVLPTGLTDEGLNILQSAIDAGVEVAVVNIMTMNFGDSFPPDKMGENTLQAATSLFEQLKSLYPTKSDDELWGMIGLTPMIGMNDVSPEVFAEADAQMVTAFAQEKGIASLAMWSLDRDKECVSGTRAISNKCSGVLQEPFAYSMIFNAFTDKD